MSDLEYATAEVCTLDLKGLFAHRHWQHIIFLTYSFDLPCFEAFLLPMLVQNGSQLITVVADAEWLAKQLTIWLERDQIREAGKRYLLCGARVAGTFHPKVVLGVSKTSGTVLIGSGNISSYGMANGGELFSVVEWQEEQVPPFAREVWELCNKVANSIPVDDRFAKHLDAMADAIGQILIPPTRRLLKHNLTEALVPQILREIPSLPVTELLLWAPFADRNLDALRELVRQLHPRQVTIALQPGITNIDGVRLAALATEYSSIRWDFVELEQKAPLKKQMIHAKGILITFATGEDILLAGSPNLSAPALFQTAQDGNLEVALLLRGPSLRRQIFPEDLISLGKPVDLNTLFWRSDRAAEVRTQDGSAIILLGASLEGITLTVKVAGTCPLTARASLNNSEQLLPLMHLNGILTVQIPEGTFPQVIKLVWNGGESNPVVVTQPQRLLEHARQKDSSPHTPLGALMNGGDVEWVMFLEKLAQICIIDAYDLVRLANGLPQPTFEQEAMEAEHPVTPEELSDIDFKAIMQMRVLHSSVATLGGLSFSSSYQIDEVVAYFKMLLDAQQRQLVTPEMTNDAEESENEVLDGPPPAVQPVPVGRKIRSLLRHRIRRFINGLRSPAFYQKVPHILVTKNYIWFLNLLEVAWQHPRYAKTTILPADIYGELCCELLAAFWGNDLEEGYWASLREQQVIEAGVMLIDNEADALTLASASRLLNEVYYREAPFVISQVVRMADVLDIFTVEACERALVYLRQEEHDPTALLQQIKMTQQYFSWARYLRKLCKKYQLRGAKLENKGFAYGKALIIDSDKDIITYPNALAVFAEWIEASVEHELGRRAFQMVWGERKDLLVYDTVSMKLSYRRFGTQQPQVLSTGNPPSQFASWSSLPLDSRM